MCRCSPCTALHTPVFLRCSAAGVSKGCASTLFPEQLPGNSIAPWSGRRTVRLAQVTRICASNLCHRKMSGPIAFLSKSEAAAVCGCSESTIQRWCHRLGLDHRYNPETNELEVSVPDLVKTGRLAVEAVPKVHEMVAIARDASEVVALRIERAALAARVDELTCRIAALSSQIDFMEALARKVGLI